MHARRDAQTREYVQEIGCKRQDDSRDQKLSRHDVLTLNELLLTEKRGLPFGLSQCQPQTIEGKEVKVSHEDDIPPHPLGLEGL